MKTLELSKMASVIALCGLVSAARASDRPEAVKATPSPSAGSAVDSQALDYLYNRNGQEGSVAGTLSDDYRKGKQTAITKQNALESITSSESLLSPAFEEFLSYPEADEEQVSRYRALSKQALGFLNERKTAEAWQILFSLSGFEWDGGISRQLANRIRSVWDTDATAKGLLADNDKLQGQVRIANWNADSQSSAVRQEKQGQTGKRKGGTSAGEVAIDATKGQIGNLRLTEEYFKSLNSKARIKLNEIRIGNIKTKAKADLVDYITTLYKSKRYSHAVLAAEFYHALFQDGELPPEVANEATASLEATRDISRAVEVFRFKIKQKQVSSASKILFQAWQTGSDTLDMIGLEREFKIPVIEHANRVRRMRNLIEARNFDSLEALLDVMEKSATDFDTTKPRALIQAIKLESSIRLGKARLFAQQGNAAKAMEEFQAAAEIWPSNPDLARASSEYFAVEDASARSMTEFDREISEGNFRAIAEKQVRFLHFIQNDQRRSQQFKDALTKVRDAEIALEKAKIQDRAGDFAGAWETIEMALENWAGDQKLNQSRGEYASKSPQFVSAIRKAQTAEEGKDLGASLSLFALARYYYPPSLLANDGLKRVSLVVLELRSDAPQDAKAVERRNATELPKAPDPQMASKEAGITP